jgi:hypothetical protein
MKCKECKEEFDCCLRKEDNQVYLNMLEHSLIKNVCVPNSFHKSEHRKLRGLS